MKYSDKLAEYRESKRYIKEHFGRKPSWFKGKKVLCEEDVKYIRENYAKLGKKELSDRLEISESTVYQIAKGITWKHLNLKYRPLL